MKKKVLLFTIISFFICTISVSALQDVENYPYKSAKKITNQGEINSKISESSKNNDEVGVLISKGTINLKELTILKNGNSTNTNELIYGSNSALLVYDGGVLNIDKASISSYGSSSNAIYINKNGTATIKNTNIKTSGKSSSGIVTSSGTFKGENLSIITDDESSPALIAFKNSTIELIETEIETNKQSSPALLSESNVKLKDCNINANISNGITIINTGNVLLDNTTLYSYDEEQDQNNTYKNIYIYGTNELTDYVTFSATNSKILTESGTPIYIKNKNTNINLSNSTFNSNSSTFLTGETTINKSSINLNLDNQEIKGNIVVDDKTTVKVQLKNSSKLIGSLLGNNKGISVVLDDTSTLVLTGNSYIASLENTKEDNSNIYLNGYKLYMNNEEIKANNDHFTEKDEVKKEQKKTTQQKAKEDHKLFVAAISILSVIVISIIIIIIITIKKINKKRMVR